MNLDLFDYRLPRELIAQHPLPRRSDSRMLVVDRVGRTIAHQRFRALPSHLRPSDCLIVNNTKVIPARLLGTKAATGGRVEVLLVEPRDSSTWEAMAKGKFRTGQRLEFGAGLRGEVMGAPGGGRIVVRLEARSGSLGAALARAGHVPLPPYITRPDGSADRQRYQTVYASQTGAVAAPTAGLHFTSGMLERLQAAGVRIEPITLHVGPGTFEPVRVQKVEEHRMSEERYCIPPAAAEVIAETRERGGRVVAVGTTVVRTLETEAQEGGLARAGAGRTALFIYSGHKFRVVDALLTNFHLPRSTLLMLVCAFAGRELVLEAYRQAVERGYRFYSYGDCMLIV